MKYEVLARATSEWAYTVEANSREEAESNLQAAIDDGTEHEIRPKIHDTGIIEIIKGATTQLP